MHSYRFLYVNNNDIVESLNGLSRFTKINMKDIKEALFDANCAMYDLQMLIVFNWYNNSLVIAMPAELSNEKEIEDREGK